MRLGALWLVGVVALGSGCAQEDALDSAGEPVTSVTWTNVVGASATGNDLVKTAATTLWDAGASSVDGLAGDGYVEFTTGENTTDKMAGLGNGDSDQGYADIEFAIRLNSSGRVAVFESGVQVFQGGTYAAGDVFRVHVLDGEVRYSKDGSVFYTSQATPSFPLRVDTSLRTPGATIEDVSIESLIFWRSVRRAHAVSSDLDKTDPKTAWNAGAVSIATLTGDGYVGFTAGDNTTDRMAGLSHGNDGTGFADIDYAVYLRASGKVSVFESGVSRGGFGTYVAGDVFRVQVAGGVVSYWKNGVRFYSSAAVPTFPLLLDTSLRTPGATVRGAVVVAGVGEEMCMVQTQRITGDEVAADSDELGRSLAAAPGLMVAGIRTPPLGAAAVYREVAGAWQLEQMLNRTDGLGIDYAYGETVDTDGQTIAVADDRDPTLGAYAGAVFVYRHDGQQWEQDGLLLGCAAEYQFGTAVAVQDDVIVVGKPAYDEASPSGRAYVFRRQPAGWVREAILSDPEGGPFDGFGQSVAICGDRLFAAMPRRDAFGNNSGVVHVYRRGDSTVGSGTCAAPAAGPWQHEATLVPSNTQANDWFGGGASGFGSAMDCNASGTQVLIGNLQFGGYDQQGNTTPNGPGTVHQFTLTPQGWRETFKFEWTDDPSAPLWEGAEFGSFIALGGPDPETPSFVVIGPQWEDSGWVYRHIGGGSWSVVGRVDNLNRQAGNAFGARVAATADAALMSTPSFTRPATTNVGAVYNFDLPVCPAP